MAEQVRGDFVEGMKKTGYKYFYETHDQHPSVHPELFRPETLDAAYVQWTILVEEDKLEEKTSELQDAPTSATIEGWTILMRARTYHKSKVWSKDTVRDHQRIENLVIKASQQWGNGVFINKEEFYADFFNSGGLTAGKDATFDNSVSGGVVTDASGDGVYDGTAASVIPFFNLSGNLRTTKSANTYFNSITGSLNEGNLDAALIRGEYTNAFSERNLQMKQMFDTLLIPRHLQITAEKLLESTGGTTDVHSGIVNPFKGRLRPITWRFLTDTDAWFVGIAKRGIVMGNRQEPEINMFIDQKNGSFWAVIDVRFGGTVEDFRPWVGVNLSTS